MHEKTKEECENLNKATKKYGAPLARTLIRRIKELRAFENFGAIPKEKPWCKEKLSGKNEVWSVRVNKKYRIEFKISEKDNDKIDKCKELSIERMSKHYE